jgi:alpha-L-rhamnosidase
MYLPATDPDKVLEHGQPAAVAPGVQFLRQETDRAVYQVSSGNYDFVSE